ncbi:type II toxin-antitoxin system RelE family toxin [Virgibacillus siamensis]|uniref:type II toxin-antitoxin system RelE family toxin n=1 Tax=Virgibacillus siamensis TaxID=480071 RepID=UPI0009852947|nr:type II toxin-antitoxin system RelE/ParE family toxin [Virgibacillus siamensis]
MNKTYNVYWSQTALDELSNILAYPPEVKERIYMDTFERLSYMPILTAKQIPNGTLKGYWVRLGLYQVMLVFEVNEEEAVVWIDGIKHKRENVYWKKR